MMPWEYTISKIQTVRNFTEQPVQFLQQIHHKAERERDGEEESENAQRCKRHIKLVQSMDFIWILKSDYYSC